ncbi:MAG TPA: hypothetical protein VK157_00480 [Phycisphaerales bacterium]|nr:hypothetical protein [Phycisphaerales bacterium]
MRQIAMTIMLAACTGATCAAETFTFRYYRPSNTGIQGDFCEAMYIGADGDPWIGGYDASFEEGGIAKFVQSENRWINVSNVDYPVIGHPNDQGTARVREIVADANGVLWMGTGHGVTKFDPAVGPSSLAHFDSRNSVVRDGWVEDVERAPDGSLWFSAYSTVWGDGGMYRYVPATNTWTRWTSVGGRIAAQAKPGGGYYIYAAMGSNSAGARFDSATNAWTHFARVAGSPGEIVGPDGANDAGDIWMHRFDSEYVSTLMIRKANGSWQTPNLPVVNGQRVAPSIVRDIGGGRWLMENGGGNVWHFDGTTWHDKGVWRAGPLTYDLQMAPGGVIWASGQGGAARRDPATGQWQRYRVTNTSQFDFFNNDLSIDQATGHVYACANAGPGAGGMVSFDGTRWTGFNQLTYGLGYEWPFNGDNSESLHVLQNGSVVVNPMFASTHVFDGELWATLPGGSSKVVSYVEDSLSRVWGLGEYYSLGTYQNGSFTNHGIAAWGQRMQQDPSRSGTVWANAGYELVRTDGTYRFSRTIDDFPELTSQSDTFSGLAVAPDGSAWVGCTVMFGAGGSGGGLLHVNANTGTSNLVTFENGWPFPGQFVQPLAVTPDGKVWMQYDSDFLTAQRGLCWWDGTRVGVFPAPAGGEPQWGGLPHAQIKELEVKLLPDGYELWMSCVSRGIAVLRVTNDTPACDDIDFNNNGVFPEDQDVIDFFLVLAGAECTTCNDIDFNNNGVFPEDQDVIDFFNVLAGGACP